MPTISIIMPVYNSEDYLSDAIESVLLQSYNDFELILIDDGSDDGSLGICKKYQSQDSRITVISQDNVGITKTRNRGIDLSQGEYIAFIDNDDIYTNDLLLDNFHLIEKYNADVVKFGSIRRKIDANNNYKEQNEYLTNIPQLIEREHLRLFFPTLRCSSILENVWNGIYRKSFLQKYRIRFEENIHWGVDDQLFNLRVCSCMTRMIYNSQTYYIWMQRESHSTSKKYSEDALKEFALMSESELNLIDTLNTDFSLTRFKQERIVDLFIHNFSLLNRQGNASYHSKKQLYKYIRSLPVYKNNITFYNILNIISMYKKRGAVCILYLLHLDLVFFRLILSLSKQRGLC